MFRFRRACHEAGVAPLPCREEASHAPPQPPAPGGTSQTGLDVPQGPVRALPAEWNRRPAPARVAGMPVLAPSSDAEAEVDGIPNQRVVGAAHRVTSRGDNAAASVEAAMGSLRRSGVFIMGSLDCLLVAPDRCSGLGRFACFSSQAPVVPSLLPARCGRGLSEGRGKRRRIDRWTRSCGAATSR